MLQNSLSSSKPLFSNMRDGQGCLLPVLSCHRHQLLLEEDPFAVMPWLLPQMCRAEVVSQFPEVLSSTTATVNVTELVSVSSNAEKRKKQCKMKGSGVKGAYGCMGRSYKAGHGHECNVSIEEGKLFSLHITGCDIHSVQPDMPVVVQKSQEAVNGLAVMYAAEDKSACNSGSDGAVSDIHEDYLPGLDNETALRCLAFVPLADHHRLALVAQKYRRLVQSSLLFELRRAYKVVEQWVCIYSSGDASWTAFDPKQNVWRNLPPANTNPFFDLSDRESLSAGTHILWLGREVFDFACYKYDLIFNSWERGPPMVNSRCLFASASCGEFAYVAGGFNVGALPAMILKSAERYDARVGKWEPLPPMETARQKCSGVFMDGKFYVIGGKDQDHNPLTSGEVYDPVSRTWKTIPHMYIPPETAPSFEPSPPLVAVANNQLYAIESSTNLLKGYNKSTNTWKVLGHVPVRADFCNGWGLAFKALGDELFVIGGYQLSQPAREAVVVFSSRPRFDAAAPEWHRDAPPLLEWKLVNLRVRGNGTFLYNCAVMVC